MLPQNRSFARTRFLYGPTDSIESDSHIKKKHDTYDECKSIASWLSTKSRQRPEIGIICGSGLGGLGDDIQEKEIFRYEDIPDFPTSTVPGHTGALILGKLGSRPVIAMQGRFHTYEGYPPWKCAMPVRVMKLFGVKLLVVTNAAGGLNPAYKVGDIMIIKDHINWPAFSGHSSLIGPNDDRFGPRFPAMSEAYNRKLRQLAKDIAIDLGFGDFIREGVYSMQSGPCFETIAEAKLIQLAGADCTGMSTVPEVVVARHCGMRVFGLSLITNECVIDYNSERTANHQEVLETGRKRSRDVQKLVEMFIEKVDLELL